MVENEKVYRINKKRFIFTVLWHFETVKNFCKVAGISRQRFYYVLNKTYKNKTSETFTKLLKCLNTNSEEAQYDHNFFWSNRHDGGK